MKTHQNPTAPNATTIIRFATWFICIVLFFSSCEKSNLEYIDAPIATIDNKPNFGPIQFSLVFNHCFAGGTNVTVNIDNPHKYNFHWELNGKYGGQGISTSSCSCGGMAKVTVTRLSDGKSLSKSVNLSDCSKNEPREALIQTNSDSSLGDNQ